MIKANFKLGGLSIQLEAADLKGLFRETELLSQCPQACGACGSKNINPAYSKSAKEGFEFYSLKCADCNSEFKFGQRKSDGGLFPKFDEGKNGWVQGFRRSDENSEAAFKNDGNVPDEW